MLRALGAVTTPVTVLGATSVKCEIDIPALRANTDGSIAFHR